MFIAHFAKILGILGHEIMFGSWAITFNDKWCSCYSTWHLIIQSGCTGPANWGEMTCWRSHQHVRGWELNPSPQTESQGSYLYTMCPHMVHMQGHLFSVVIFMYISTVFRCNSVGFVTQMKTLGQCMKTQCLFVHRIGFFILTRLPQTHGVGFATSMGTLLILFLEHRWLERWGWPQTWHGPDVVGLVGQLVAHRCCLSFSERANTWLRCGYLKM